MKEKFRGSKPSAKTNFIGAFLAVVLIGIEVANKLSANKNEYSVFNTADDDKVGIMSGELEHLHRKEGAILTKKNGQAWPQDADLENQDVYISDKRAIGRGDDGQLFSEAA